MGKKRKTRPSELESSSATGIELERQPSPRPNCQHEEVEAESDQVPERIKDGSEQEHVNEDEEEEHTENMVDDENENQGEQEEGLEDGVEEETKDSVASVVQEADGGGKVGEEEEELEEEPIEKLLEHFGKEQLVVLLKEAVSKHPELIELLYNLADAHPAHRKIFVHGLGWDTNAETLTSVFGKYGDIEDCKAVVDKVSGKSKGYAFILFKHRSGSRKALKQPQKNIGNRMTFCQLASAGPIPAPLPTAPPFSEYTQRKIFVSNVSPEVNIQKLLEFFSKFGEIEDGPLGLDKQTGKPKGFCLFVYKSSESAKKALEEPHKNFEGGTLHCQKAIDGPKPGKPFFQQQQHPRPHHHQYHPHSSRKEKNNYSAGGGARPGHLMAPSRPSMSFNAAVGATPALGPALGHALTALLATQGAGLGLNSLLGGLGAPMNQGVPQVMNNPAGYGNQPGASYGNQQGMQGGYQNPQMWQGGTGMPQTGGGAPYMGHGY